VHSLPERAGEQGLNSFPLTTYAGGAAKTAMLCRWQWEQRRQSWPLRSSPGCISAAAAGWACDPFSAPGWSMSSCCLGIHC
jgi:hypothetical protein